MTAPRGGPAPVKGAWPPRGTLMQRDACFPPWPCGVECKRPCLEGHAAGPGFPQLCVDHAWDPGSRPASLPPRTSSSRIRNSSSSFWSLPSWTSCFNRASSASICLICKIKGGRDTGGHVRSIPGLSRQLLAVGGDSDQPGAWPRALIPAWVCVGPPREPGEPHPEEVRCPHMAPAFPGPRQCSVQPRLALSLKDSV